MTMVVNAMKQVPGKVSRLGVDIRVRYEAGRYYFQLDDRNAQTVYEIDLEPVMSVISEGVGGRHG